MFEMDEYISNEDLAIFYASIEEFENVDDFKELGELLSD